MIDSFGVTEIPGVEESGSLTYINITRCESIETLPDLSRCEKLRSLLVRDCMKVTKLRGLEKLDLICWDISGCISLETILELPRISLSWNHEAWENGGVGDKIMLR